MNQIQQEQIVQAVRLLSVHFPWEILFNLSLSLFKAFPEFCISVVVSTGNNMTEIGGGERDSVKVSPQLLWDTGRAGGEGGKGGGCLT